MKRSAEVKAQKRSRRKAQGDTNKSIWETRLFQLPKWKRETYGKVYGKLFTCHLQLQSFYRYYHNFDFNNRVVANNRLLAPKYTTFLHNSIFGQLSPVFEGKGKSPPGMLDSSLCSSWTAKLSCPVTMIILGDNILLI